MTIEERFPNDSTQPHKRQPRHPSRGWERRRAEWFHCRSPAVASPRVASLEAIDRPAILLESPLPAPATLRSWRRRCPSAAALWPPDLDCARVATDNTNPATLRKSSSVMLATDSRSKIITDREIHRAYPPAVPAARRRWRRRRCCVVALEANQNARRPRHAVADLVHVHQQELVLYHNGCYVAHEMSWLAAPSGKAVREQRPV